MDQMLRHGAMLLAQYQSGVGKEPLEMLGVDFSKLPQTNNLEALRAEAQRAVEAERKTRDRFNVFNKLVKTYEKQEYTGKQESPPNWI